MLECRSGGADTREIRDGTGLPTIAALPEDYRIVSALYLWRSFVSGDRGNSGLPSRNRAVAPPSWQKKLQKALWHIAEQQGIIATSALAGE